MTNNGPVPHCGAGPLSFLRGNVGIYWFCTMHNRWLITVNDVRICPDGKTDCDKTYHTTSDMSSYRYWVLV